MVRPGFAAKLQHDRMRDGLRVCRAAWLIGVSVHDYRELDADERWPTVERWDRICHAVRMAADVRR
jgi:hypothetical protein